MSSKKCGKCDVAFTNGKPECSCKCARCSWTVSRDHTNCDCERDRRGGAKPKERTAAAAAGGSPDDTVLTDVEDEDLDLEEEPAGNVKDLDDLLSKMQITNRNNDKRWDSRIRKINKNNDSKFAVLDSKFAGIDSKFTAMQGDHKAFKLKVEQEMKKLHAAIDTPSSSSRGGSVFGDSSASTAASAQQSAPFIPRWFEIHSWCSFNERDSKSLTDTETSTFVTLVWDSLQEDDKKLLDEAALRNNNKREFCFKVIFPFAKGVSYDDRGTSSSASFRGLWACQAPTCPPGGPQTSK